MTARTLPVPPNWFAGSKLTASAMNGLTNTANFWADPPSFRMRQTVVQSVANSTDTQITCDFSQWDSDTGRASGSPYNYTIPAGWGNGMRWTFEYCVCFNASGGGTRWAFLKQNGTGVADSRFQIAGAADPICVGGTCSLIVNSGDTIALWGGQTSGAALSTSSSNLSFLGGWLHGLGTP